MWSKAWLFVLVCHVSAFATEEPTSDPVIRGSLVQILLSTADLYDSGLAQALKTKPKTLETRRAFLMELRGKYQSDTWSTVSYEQFISSFCQDVRGLGDQAKLTISDSGMSEAVQYLSGFCGSSNESKLN